MTSPDQPDPADPLATARYLGASLDNLAKELGETRKASEKRDAELARYGRRNRVAVVLDIALTIVVALIAWQSNGASDRASSAAARAAAATAAEQALYSAQISGCVSGNQYRAGVVASLDRLTMLLEGPHPSPAVQKAAASYEQYVLTQNKPRNCQQAYALKPQPKVTADAKR